MKKGLLTMAGVLLTVSLVSAGTTVPVLAEEEQHWYMEAEIIPGSILLWMNMERSIF